MLLLCYNNNISLENLDDNTFPSIKGGKIPLEDVAYIPIFSQRKETKWYSDIRNLITSDGVHLNHNITQLFGPRVDNVEEARSYNITKKNRSLIAFYNSQFNSVVIGKIQGIDETMTYY
ncbi:unnamed protein product [Rhizophagus irregularis]|nr:unnamed protein product [Rhizophagus irregularis]